MVKAVFFDLYQTLVRYKPSQAEVEAQALGEMGYNIAPEALERPILAANEYLYNQYAKRPLSQRTREEMMALYIEYQHIVMKEAGLEAGEKVVLKLMEMMQKVRLDLILFDDSLPALAELKKRGLVTGLISNIDKNMNDVIQKLGIASKLDVIVTSLDAEAAKPDPEIFRYALQKTNVKAPDSIYIGDQYQVTSSVLKPPEYRASYCRADYYTGQLDCPKISLNEITRFLK